MRGWSIPVGSYFGVEVRLHALMVLTLPALVLFSGLLSDAAMRGVALWLLLLAAVLVREVGRGLATAFSGVAVTRLVLLPTGAAPVDDAADGPLRWERLVAMAGPLANFFAGITMALLMYSATAKVNLFLRPLFGPLHLLRSAIWAQVLLGGLNLLPAYPLDAGILLRRQINRVRSTAAVNRSTVGLGQGLSTLLILLGAATLNSWLILMGCSLLLTSRAAAVAVNASSAAETVLVREVMLSEYTTLAASDTLEDALTRSVQSMQEVFPVVRGQVVVGSVSRSKLSQALRVDGNAYVQSAMTRELETASPDDLLLPTLRKIQHGESTELIPVVHDDQVVGILTPGSLSQAMGLLGRTRRLVPAPAQADRDA